MNVNKENVVQPIRCGEWEEERYNDCLHCYSAICSKCGCESTDFYSITETHSFCEFCGARMQKGGDVQSVDTENMATVSDEFICKKCGIYLKDYIKVVMEEDNDGYIDEQHYEYEPKFCPECGAKVKEGDTE